MNTNSKLGHILPCLLISSLLTASATSQIFVDDFNRADGALGSPWTIGNTNQTDIVSNQARFLATLDPYVVGVNAAAFSATTNFSLSVDLSFPNSTQAGLWFLGKPDTSVASGYAVRLNAATSVIQMVNFLGSTSFNTAGWSSAVFTTIGAINNTDVFRMVVATSATANSFDVSLTNLTTAASVFSFTATRESAFANPNAGNLFGLYGQGTGARFDNFTAVVPEPSTYALVVLAVVGLGAVGLRRRAVTGHATKARS
jgi:hypothetical protein